MDDIELFELAHYIREEVAESYWAERTYLMVLMAQTVLKRLEEQK